LVSAVGAGQVCRVLLVEGEPGIGKSRLLADLADRVTCAGGRALGARSFEAEAAVRAYGIWIDFLRAVPDEEVPEDLRMSLATLRPGLGHAPSGPGDRTRLFDAVADLLRRMAARCPTVLILDDVQWIDEASAALLHYLVRAVGPASPLIFACAARSGELEDNVAAARVARTLGREGRLLMLPLGPLGLEQTAELVRTADPALDAPTVAAESEGNPLLALELARARGGQGWGDAASATLDAIVAGRLARLTDRARELLVWAAALGRGIDPGLLGRVSELHSLGLASVLEEWERRCLVRPAPAGRGGEGYDFTHDLIRQAVYRSASQPRRRLVHGHIARVLRTAIEDDDALAGDLVRHAELSGDHALAAHACRAAGDRCLRLFAVTEAAGLAERGLLHLDRLANAAQSSVARIDLLRIRVRAAQGPGRRRLPDITPAVVDATVAAEAAGLAAAAAMGHHLLSVLHHDAGNDESARDSTLRAAVAGQAVADVTARARRLANTARCLVDLELEVGRARRLMAEAEALARAQGIELCELYWGRGLLERWDGALDSAVPPIERALALARARQDRWREYQCLTWLAITLLEQGRWAETRIRCAELSEVASKLGAEEGPMADVLDALALLGIGDAMPQADEQLRVAVARLRAVDHKAHLAYALNAVAELHLRTGRTEEARACAEEALATATAVRRDGEVAVARATLLRLGYAGEPREVKAEVEHLLAAAAAPDRLGARARTAIRDAAARAKSDVVPTLAPTAGA
jgi:tetratricopeptide (TPR) repeat protein